MIHNHIQFLNNREKARWMQDQAVKDSHHPLIQQLARRFSHLKGKQCAEAILAFCQKAIRYQRDPGGEVLESSIAALDRGYADCDAKARLFVALGLACGLYAKIKPFFVGLQFPHVAAEVLIDGHFREADPTWYDSTLDTRGTKTTP